MNFGMIGALGGIGGGLVKESDRMGKIEDEERADARAEAREVRADGRQRSFQDWLLNKKREFQIEDEVRGDRRAEDKKDRDFERDQREAPTRRGMKTEDAKAEARAKSEAAAENVDRDAGVKKKLTEAGQTDSQRDLQGAQADYYRERPKGTEGKLSGADGEEAKRMGSFIDDTKKKIRDGRIDGSWDDQNLTPAQKKVQAELIATEKRYRSILDGARGGGGAAPAKGDPLGIRKAPAAPAGGGKVGGMIGGPADDDRVGIYRQEFRQANERLSAAKTDVERQRAQNDIDGLKREAQRLNISLEAGAGPLATAKMPPAAPAAAPAAAPVAAPAAPGTPKGALEGLLAGDQTAGGAAAPGKPAKAAAGGDDRAAKVDKLKAQASGQTAAPAAAAPGPDPLLQAMGAAGGGSIDQILSKKAPALRQAAEGIRAAQQQVVQAAKSQNPQATQQATQAVQQASAQLDALLADMNPAQAQQVKRALGI